MRSRLPANGARLLRESVAEATPPAVSIPARQVCVSHQVRRLIPAPIQREYMNEWKDHATENDPAAADFAE
jgi:hypothetical protein